MAHNFCHTGYMGMRITGMASGLPPNIVEQIMEAERIPVRQMNDKKLQDEEKLKLVGEISEKISSIPKAVEELVGIKGFKNNIFNSGDANVINGVVDPDKAINGQWQVEVLQLAQKPGVVSNGFPDKNETLLGAGYFKFNTKNGEKEVYIKRENSTLEQVAQAINKSGHGVTAQVVENSSDNEAPYRLMITGIDTGNKKDIEFPYVYLLDGEEDFEFDQKISAKNAKIKLDGFEMELAENSAKDIIPGVNLEIKQLSQGRPILISVKEDFQVIGGKIKEFVDAYNGALSWIQNQAKLSKDKGGRQRLGPMGGDSLLRSIESKLRQVIQNSSVGTAGSIQRASQLGIEFTRNGTLNFNQEKFNKVLTSQPQEVVQFLRGNSFTSGFIPMVKNVVGSLNNSTSGPLGTRRKGIQDRIKQIDERIERKENQLVKKEESLRRKFADLETKMSKLQSQGASLAGMVKPAG